MLGSPGMRSWRGAAVLVAALAILAQCHAGDHAGGRSLAQAEVEDEKCIASTLPGMTCLIELSSKASLHWSVAGASVTMALRVQQRSDYYVGLGFPTRPVKAGDKLVMDNAEAIVGGMGSEGTTLASFKLNGDRTVDKIEGLVEFTDGSIEAQGGFVTLKFTRPMAASGTGAISISDTSADFIYSFGPTLRDGRPSYHLSNQKGEVSGVSLAKGGGTVSMGEDLKTEHVVHGVLMTIAWGVLIPLGMISARYMKHHGPKWFQAHRGLVVSGVLLGTVAIAIALAKFEIQGDDKHNILGLVVFALSLVLVAAGALRPDKEHSLRGAWFLAHSMGGRAAAVCAWVNIFWGLGRYDRLHGGSGANNAQIAFAAWLGALGLLALYLEYMLAKRDSAGAFALLGVKPREVELASQ